MDLPSLQTKGIQRYLFNSHKTLVETQIHGFADASSKAYGGVIYARARYSDTSVTVSLLTSKTRVAPLKGFTIPRLKLCGAQLTARLLWTSAKDLVLPLSQVFAWTDSTIVLSWLNSTTSRLKVYVANRVTDFTQAVPASYWRHVPTESNPADLTSRGTSPSELLAKTLWWESPPWLPLSPTQWPV